MAEAADVETALVALLTGGFYPTGTAAPSVVGVLCRLYRGNPVAAALDRDLRSNVVNISVLPMDNGWKNVTRYPRNWAVIVPPARSLSLSVANKQALFSGQPAEGQIIGVLIDRRPYSYAVQKTDSLSTIASNIAALLRSDGWTVEYEAYSFSVPTAVTFMARVVSGAFAMQELRRQKQMFTITAWCGDPFTRDQVSHAVNQILAPLVFIPLSDGSFGRILFEGSQVSDTPEGAILYKQTFMYSVEYPTTNSELMPAMLFGETTVTLEGSQDINIFI